MTRDLKDKKLYPLSKDVIYENLSSIIGGTVNTQLIGNNWVYDEMPESTTIRTYIKNLRKKLNDETITTLKGIGYRFNIR